MFFCNIEDIPIINDIISIELKMKIQPLTIKNGTNFKFHISYESFQNPDFIEDDLKEITILEDHLGNPYSASTWEYTQEGNYKKTGILTFSASSVIPKELTLYIYHPNETQYKWTFENKVNLAQKKNEI